jgi:PAS domain S-box-containing protein
VPANSFSLYTTARNVSEQLRRRIATESANGKGTPAELEAALEEIQVLWEELHNQSASLADERHRYAEFFEYAPEPYLVTEPLGEIREANRAACELFGERPEALEGQLILDRVPEPERSAFRAKLIAVRGQPESELALWAGTLRCKSGVSAVQFRVRSIKVRRKNADGLCWMIRPLDGHASKADGQGTPNES